MDEKETAAGTVICERKRNPYNFVILSFPDCGDMVLYDSIPREGDDYMKTYLEVIEQALIFFPLAAMIMTVPYVIYNYRKYGSVLSLRILIVYSFVLYMLCTCFLVILPLPSFEAVARMNGPEMQMIPFMFVSDMAKDFKVLFQVLFNVLVTVPFGIYLRYYFRCSLRKTILCSFLLSLFYELTQLTGLYFIYPGSYRLFDVDDLMANTLGGLLGYGLLEPLKNGFLREKNRSGEFSAWETHFNEQTVDRTGDRFAVAASVAGDAENSAEWFVWRFRVCGTDASITRKAANGWMFPWRLCGKVFYGECTRQALLQWWCLWRCKKGCFLKHGRVPGWRVP